MMKAACGAPEGTRSLPVELAVAARLGPGCPQVRGHTSSSQVPARPRPKLELG